MAKLYSRLIKPNALTAYEGLKFIAKRQKSNHALIYFCAKFLLFEAACVKLRFASGFAWDKFGFKDAVLGLL